MSAVDKGYIYKELTLPKDQAREDNLVVANESTNYERRYILITGPETVAFMVKRMREGTSPKGKTWKKWEDVGVVRASVKKRGNGTTRKLNVYSRYRKSTGGWLNFTNSTNDIPRVYHIIPVSLQNDFLDAVETIYTEKVGKSKVSLQDYKEKPYLEGGGLRYLTALAYPMEVLRQEKTPNDIYGLNTRIPSAITKASRAKTVDEYAQQILGKKNFDPKYNDKLLCSDKGAKELIVLFKNLVPKSDLYRILDEFKPKGTLYLEEQMFAPELRAALRCATVESRVALLDSLITSMNPRSMNNHGVFTIRNLRKSGYKFDQPLLEVSTWGELASGLQTLQGEHNRSKSLEDISLEEAQEMFKEMGLSPQFSATPSPRGGVYIKYRKDTFAFKSSPESHFVLSVSVQSKRLAKKKLSTFLKVYKENFPKGSESQPNLSEIMNFFKDVSDIAPKFLKRHNVPNTVENKAKFLTLVFNYIYSSRDGRFMTYLPTKIYGFIREDFTLEQIELYMKTDLTAEEAIEYKDLPDKWVRKTFGLEDMYSPFDF